MSQIHELKTVKGRKIGRATTKILYTWNVDEINYVIHRDKFSTIYVPKCCFSDMFLKIDPPDKGLVRR